MCVCVCASRIPAQNLLSELMRTVAQARDIEESGRVYLETYRTLNVMSMRSGLYDFFLCQKSVESTWNNSKQKFMYCISW